MGRTTYPFKSSVLWLVIVGGLMALAAPAMAQSDAQRNLQRLQRQSQRQVSQTIPPERRALIDYGGYAAFNYFSTDDSIGDNHVLREYDLTAYFRMALDPHQLYFQGRLRVRDFHRGDSFDGEGDITDGILDYAFYKYDLRRDPNPAHSRSLRDFTLGIGRQPVRWGTGLVLDQDVDAINLLLAADVWELRLLGGVTVPHTIDWDTSRPGFDDLTRRGFYGVELAAQLGAHRPFLYAIAQQDYNDTGPLELGPLVTHFQYDSFYLGAGGKGALTDHLYYAVEFVYEGGSTLSNSFDDASGFPIPQTTDDIHAWAASLRCDYVPATSRRWRITSQLLLASGDSDRGNTSDTFNGNQPGTDDLAFNALGLIDTGIVLAPPVSNLLALRLGTSWYPFDQVSLRQLQLGADLFIMFKLDPNAPIDEPTNDQQYLGIEPNFFVNWAITEDVAISARYGVFFLSAAFEGESGDIRQAIFFGVTYAF
jgi:hypothetical protein